MSEKYKDKYTIKSSRLSGYDYSQNGMYFITICTKDRAELFGEIENEKIILSEVGKIVEKFWQEIPKHFSFINLDEFIIMPNHVHGIVEIKNNPVETRFIASEGVNNVGFIASEGVNNVGFIASEGVNAFGNPQDAINCVSTDKKLGGITGNYNPLLNPFSISKVIKWYKGRCAFEIRKQLNPITFAWQSRFYDHIIRNEISLNKIREYIQINPKMWEQDRNNVENLWM